MLVNPPVGQIHVEHEDGTITFPNQRRSSFVFHPIPEEPGWYYVPEFEDERYGMYAGPCKVCGHLRELRNTFTAQNDEPVCAACALAITESVLEAHVPYTLKEIVKQASGERQIIPTPLRDAVYKRDQYQCRYCGAKDDLTLDHVYPHHLGGGDTYDNLVTACRPCNSKKHTKTLEEAGMELLPLGGAQ